MAFWLQFLMSDMAFLVLLHVLLLVVGFLFILDFPMPKPGLKHILGLVAVMAVTVGIILAFTKFRVPSPADRSNQIVDELIDEICESTAP